MRFEIETKRPVAIDSPDHIMPRGTKLDNSKNMNFNRYLLEMFDDKPSVLDFGCAGGGMVKTFVDSGCVAIGLEGSDYNLKQQRAEWATIPDNLFTCDIGYRFILHTGDRNSYKFDVITMWEFVEHISTDRVDRMIKNAKAHLKPNGYIFGSTNDHHSIYQGVEHHQTIRPFSWWAAKFAEHGFSRKPHDELRFNKHNAWVRKGKSKFILKMDV